MLVVDSSGHMLLRSREFRGLGFRDLGGLQTEEMLACTYRSMKTMAGFAKQLREELLEVVILAHTEEKTQRSVFHRITSLELGLQKVQVYIGEGRNHYESTEEQCYRSERVIRSHSVQRVTTSQRGRERGRGSQDESAGIAPVLDRPLLHWEGGTRWQRRKEKEKGDES